MIRPNPLILSTVLLILHYFPRFSMLVFTLCDNKHKQPNSYDKLGIYKCIKMRIAQELENKAALCDKARNKLSFIYASLFDCGFVLWEDFRRRSSTADCSAGCVTTEGELGFPGLSLSKLEKKFASGLSLSVASSGAILFCGTEFVVAASVSISFFRKS